MKSWYLFLGVLSLAWLWFMAGFGFWREALQHWRIALVMVLGSLVAGATPMGGGTVAFPFLVLALGYPPESARNFGLAVQSLGMTSAMIFILCRRVPLQGRMIAWSSVGAAFGILGGHFLVAPYIGKAVLKLLFSCLWMSFALLTMVKNHEMCALAAARPLEKPAALKAGLAVGLLGGVLAAMLGVGVEMATFVVLVLLFRNDMKVAVPTAVSGMAVASVIGTALHGAIGDFDREMFMNLLVSTPVVLFGAPLGTYVVSLVSRVTLLYFVSALCVFQFVWTLWQVSPTATQWAFVAAAMLAANAGFYLLYRRGKAVAPAG